MNRKIIIKLAAVGALVFAAVVVWQLYQATFSDEAKAKKVAERWEQLQKLPLPEGASRITEGQNGGAHYYGIDCHKSIVLEITGMSRGEGVNNAAEQVVQHYVDFFTDWHDEIDTVGKSEEYTTLQGEPGLIVIKADAFWYGDAETRKFTGPGAVHVLQTYDQANGRGRRFIAVTVIICTR